MSVHSVNEEKSTPLKAMSQGVNSMLRRIFYNPYKKAGVSWLRYRYIKYFGRGEVKMHRLNGHPTFFYNTAEYFHGVREVMADETYKQELAEGSVLIDCGAHIGLSVIYLKNLCPSCSIIAFEPDGRNFALLQKNVSSHGLNNVTLRNEAVWTENGTINFLQEGTMSSKIQSVNSANSIQVKATRLKDLLQQPVAFLKLDIEGAEYEVLKDIQTELHQVGKMFIEYHGSIQHNERLTEMFDIMTKAGFSYYIKEAAFVDLPFLIRPGQMRYDVQLNIFCFRSKPESA